MENSERTNCFFLVKCGGADVIEDIVCPVGPAGLDVAVFTFQVKRKGSVWRQVKGICTELLET